MITGELRNQVDRIWDAFWSGGISNSLEVIEQITYLLFLRRLLVAVGEALRRHHPNLFHKRTFASIFTPGCFTDSISTTPCCASASRMTSPAFSHQVAVDSPKAISALSKEKLRMKTRRYQKGSLMLQKRKSLPDVWVFRYYADRNGHRAYKSKTVGTVLQFPKRKDAEKAITQLRININEGAEFAPMNIAQLVAHYKSIELPRLAPST